LVQCSGCHFAGLGGLGKAIGDPDRVFIDGGAAKIPKLCIEVKPHWASGKSWASKNVITSYNEELLACRNTGKAKGPVMLTIEQAYLYMVLNHHRWAVVTSFNFSFVLERVEDVDQPQISKIRVSPTISCFQTQPYNIICAWAYVISLVQSGTRWMYASPHSSLVSSPHPLRKLEVTDKYVSADISGSFRWSNILARSLCGAVAIGLFHGIERIFKTIDKSKNRDGMELFNSEVSVYKALESIQGIHIPEFIAFGDVGGLLQVIVLENVGTPITEQQYAERRDDIQKAVAAINSLGYTHGDLRLPNITIDSNNNIRIIDFGMASPNLSPEYLPDSL
jgi:serine/threonine protein kinase